MNEDGNITGLNQIFVIPARQQCGITVWSSGLKVIFNKYNDKCLKTVLKWPTLNNQVAFEWTKKGTLLVWTRYFWPRATY